MLFVFLFFFTVLFLGKAWAITYDVSLTPGAASSYGSNAITDNPDSYFDIWWDLSGSSGITVTLTPHCGNSPNITLIVQGYGSSSGSCSNSTISKYFVPGSGCSNEEDDHQFCHAILDVNASGPSGHSPFNVTVSGNGDPSISFAGSQNPNNNPAGESPPWQGQYHNIGEFNGSATFNFTVPCSYTSNQPVYVAWSGVDWDAPYQGGVVPSWTWTDQSSNGSVFTAHSNKSELGSYYPTPDESVHSHAFNVSAGDKVSWSWSGVSGSNEVVYSVPYSGNSFRNSSCVQYTITPHTNGSTNNVSTKTGDPGVEKDHIQNTVVNSGPSNASFKWWVQGSYNGQSFANNNCGGQGTNINNCPLPSGTVTNGAVGTDVNSNYTYQFPSNANKGDKYCQNIEAQYTSGPKAGNKVDSNGTCVTYNPSPTGTVTGNITGNVYLFDPIDGNTAKDRYGVQFYNCSSFLNDNGNGSYGFSENNGAGFCDRITSPPPSGYNGPYTRPYGTGNEDGYIDLLGGLGDYAWCPWEESPTWWTGVNKTGFNSNHLYPNPNHCEGESSYEWQYAGVYKAPSATSQDRNDDSGYDFVYEVNPPFGNVDTANCGLSNGLSGWTLEQAVPDNDIWGLVYVDGVPTGWANLGVYRPDVAAVFGVSADHGFTYPLTGSIADGNNHTIQVLAVGQDMYGGWDGQNVWLPAVTMAGCRPYNFNPTATATPARTNENPGSVNFTLNPGYSPSPAGGAPGCVNGTTITYTFYKNGSPLSGTRNSTGCYGYGSVPLGSVPVPPGTFDAGDQFCVVGSLSPSSGYVYNNGTQVPGTTSGSAAFSACMTVENEPYVKVYGNSVSAAGGPVENGYSCSGGQLTSWNNDSGLYPGYGSGAELAALATRQISGFSSALNTSSFNAATGHPGQGLTFGNVSNNSSEAYQDTPQMGGNYGASFCYGLNVTNLPSTGLPTSNVSSLSGNGRYVTGSGYSSGSGAIINGGTVANNTNSAIYVKGNVYIAPGPSGGIVYNGTGWTWSPTSTNIPSFALVAVGGNIYIDPSVTNLDGVYAAVKSSGHGGNIYDCSDSPNGQNFAPMPYTGANNLFNSCNHQLVVHGSFIADNVKLMRTFGSLRDETAPRRPLGSTPPPTRCSNPGLWVDHQTCAAEVFDFSPEVYIGNYQLTPGNNNSLQYDSYTSLPPVL